MQHDGAWEEQKGPKYQKSQDSYKGDRGRQGANLSVGKQEALMLGLLIFASSQSYSEMLGKPLDPNQQWSVGFLAFPFDDI